MAQVDEKLMNQSAFAKRCGVTSTTIKNYVERDGFKPASTVGGHYYFSESQLYDVLVLNAKKSLTQSFLCVVCEPTEDEVDIVKKQMLIKVFEESPDAKGIASLRDSVASMDSKNEVTLTKDVLFIANQRIVDGFIKEVREMVSDAICTLFREEPKSRTYCFDFFLSYICGRDVDSAMVESYRSLGVVTLAFTLDGLKQKCQLQYQNIQRRWGMFNVCNQTNFGIWESFYSGTSFLAESDAFKYDSSSPCAKNIVDKLTVDTENRLVSDGLVSICRTGFYSLVLGVVFSDKEVADIVSKIMSGDYKKIFVSKKEKLPNILALTLEAIEKEGRISVVWF